MNEIYQNDKNFKAALGEFVLAFTELEFVIVDLCTWTSDSIKNRKENTKYYLKDTLSNNRSHLSNFIKNHLPELLTNWTEINAKIGQLNLDRRHLVHGLVNYSINQEETISFLHHKGQLKRNNYDEDKIKELTDKIHHILTGENGINGEFHIDFVKCLLNHHNKTSNDKIVYRINGEPITDYKG